MIGEDDVDGTNRTGIRQRRSPLKSRREWRWPRGAGNRNQYRAGRHTERTQVEIAGSGRADKAGNKRLSDRNGGGGIFKLSNAIRRRSGHDLDDEIERDLADNGSVVLLFQNHLGREFLLTDQTTSVPFQINAVRLVRHLQRTSRAGCKRSKSRFGSVRQAAKNPITDIGISDRDFDAVVCAGEHLHDHRHRTDWRAGVAIAQVDQGLDAEISVRRIDQCVDAGAALEERNEGTGTGVLMPNFVPQDHVSLATAVCVRAEQFRIAGGEIIRLARSVAKIQNLLIGVWIIGVGRIEVLTPRRNHRVFDQIGADHHPRDVTITEVRGHQRRT